MSRLSSVALLCLATLPLSAAAPAWVARSNENAQILLAVTARFYPEGAGQLGVPGLDERVIDLKPGTNERERAATREALAELQKRLTAERDPLIRQDLEILITAAQRSIHESEVNEKLLLPYINPVQVAFGGLRSLLDDQVAASRRPAALVRLRRYAGMEPGYTPLTQQVEERFRERLSQPGLLGPARVEVEKDLANANFFITGIGQLLEKYGLHNYEQPYAKLKEQFANHEAFVRKEILPRSRNDFRLPPELYALAFEQYGIDIPPAQLATMAHTAFNDIQRQMQSIAAKIAAQRKLSSTDYRAVIRELKKDQLVGDAILPHYQKRLSEIEEIIRREHLVTLPTRAARIRLATAAESAQTPAPHMRPPRLVNNTGEMGEFVLPLNVPGKNGEMQKFDDFTFSAASWTLTSHEARPGHEMQFAAMVEAGVSSARAVFAFNSTNVEGWGLYSESIMLPYMPLEGQLISLQHRLMRAARAYLDPELQMGKVTPTEANRILREEVVLSEAMANQEVERYTFRTPGQACSYFYGYTRLNELRTDVDKALGAKFNAQRYHDFILSQGLLPPALLRKAVMQEFVR